MERKNERVFYTREDKQHMTLKNYTAEEIKQNLKRYARKSRPRRSLLLAAFVISLIVAVNCNTDPYSFFSYIFVILFATGELLSETMYWLNRKNAASCYYVEIIVDRKEKVETYICHDAVYGSDFFQYYPVSGKDTTTGYSSIWYLDKNMYRNIKVGDIVRKNI